MKWMTWRPARRDPESPVRRHRIQDLELPDVLLSRHEHVHDRGSRHIGRESLYLATFPQTVQINI